MLSRIVQRAVHNKWLDDNLVLEVRREREPRAKIDPLTFEEVKRLFDSLADDPEMQRLFEHLPGRDEARRHPRHQDSG